MSEELPQGWVTAPLDSLCQKLRGVSYGREDASSVPKNGYVPILRANNLQNDRLDFDELVWVSADHVSDQQELKTGDIVIAMSSGSKSVVGKTAQVMEEWQGSFGAFCGVLRPWPELNSRYVGLFLRTREYRSTISELAAGSNINNLKNEHLAAIELPLAPLGEQRRIVAKLTELLGKVDASQQRLAMIPVLLKRFRQSVLAAACSGRLTADWREENPDAESAVALIHSFNAKPLAESNDDIPDTWCWGKFGELVTNYDGKRVPVKQSDRDKRSGPYPYYGAFGVIDDIDEYLYDGDYLLLAEDGKNLESRLRPISLIASGKFWVNNHAHVLQSKGGIPLSFLNAWLNSPTLDLSEFLTGIDQVKLNRAAMDRIPVPIAPIPEQQEIVRRVEGLFALADQLEVRLAKARGQVEKLTPSLPPSPGYGGTGLARAFAGQLVSQDPTDEPASALLERSLSARHAKPITNHAAANSD